MMEKLNKKILVTKEKKESEKHFSHLINNGVEMVYFPTIEVISRIEDDGIKSTLMDSNNFDYIIFTSANSVEVFYEAMQKLGIKITSVKITAIGNSTAEICADFGFNVDIIPDTFSSKGLIEKLSSLNIIGKRILIPGSSISREELKIGLSELGGNVVFVPIYDVQHREKADLQNEIELINTNKPDVFVFTSPSSFKYFLKLAEVDNSSHYFEGKTICAIGPTTEAAVKDFGLIVSIVPEMYSLDGIEKAIFKFYNLNLV